jgi:hypothetical protein
MKAQYQNAATTETLLYGVKIGEPDYMAEVLYECKGYVNSEELIKKGEQWANDNGYDRLRVSVIDLSTPPNFVKALNV